MMPTQLLTYMIAEVLQEDSDSGAEVSEDEPTLLSPLRDDAAVTVSLHNGEYCVVGTRWGVMITCFQTLCTL